RNRAVPLVRGARAQRHRIVQRQPEPQLHVLEALSTIRGHDERQGRYHVRGDLLLQLPLAHGFENDLELQVVQVTQAAVNELGALAAGSGGEVALLYQSHLQPAGGGILRDARAGDAATDDDQVILPAGKIGGRPRKTEAFHGSSLSGEVGG